MSKYTTQCKQHKLDRMVLSEDTSNNDRATHQRCECCEYVSVGSNEYLRESINSRIILCSKCDLHICKECMIMDDNGIVSGYRLLSNLTKRMKLTIMYLSLSKNQQI